MATLDAILREQFGFKDSHFDEYGHVYVNSMDGTISSMPAPMERPPTIVLPISEVFKVGHELKIKASARDPKHASLRILAINDQGISAITPTGDVGFFPWETLSFGISTPSQIEITPFAEALDAPLSTLRAANKHMEHRLANEKTAVHVTEKHLASIVEQRKPSTQAGLKDR